MAVSCQYQHPVLEIGIHIKREIKKQISLQIRENQALNYQGLNCLVKTRDMRTILEAQ